MEFEPEVTIKKEYLEEGDTDTKAVVPNSPTGNEIHVFKTELDVEDFNYKLEELHHSIDIKDEFLEFENEINVYKEHSYAAELQQNTCIFCDFKSTRRWTLRVHLMGHRKNDQVQQCQVCFYFKTTNKSVLENHMKIHFPDKSYKCRFCNHESADKSEYDAHVKTKHTNKKRFTCGICYYICNNQPRFEAHIAKHVDDWTTCELCKSCNTTTSVKTHFRDHSSEAFSCFNCNFKCSHKPVLVRHVKKHKTITFNCNICDYVCSAQGSFKVHMRKHAGEMYSCSVCDYKCNYKTSLKTHERKHTGETFSCADCDYKGISKENLVKHTNIHSRKKQHRCFFCNFKCDRTSVFNIHMKIHHSGEKTL